ncbi:MAG: hypothetical protein QM765_49405 [Myxococcales bacterium]
MSKTGDFLEVLGRSPIRAALERHSGKERGNAMELDPEARADPETFVQNL